LAEGTRARDWQRISREAEARGCSIATAAGSSVQVVALDGLAEDWERLIEWALELTLEATFPGDRCAWICEQAVAELESLADLPEVVTGWSFLDQFYPGHPLGRPLLGTIEGLSSLTGEQCASFHQSCLARGPMLSMTGEIDPQTVALRLEGIQGELFSRASETPYLEDPPRPVEPRRRILLPPGEQAHLFVGAPTVRRADSDYEAVRLLGVILGAGSGLVGRIPQRIREDEGLAYGCEVNSVAGAGVDRGRLVVSLGTSRADAERASAIVREELEQVRVHGISEAEIEMARSYLLGREPFGRETARQWALVELESMLWGLPLDRPEWVRRQIAGVDAEDVCRAANTYLEPSRLIETVGIPQ
jgi:zinc protease